MTTGEGGMIVTDREDWTRLFRSLRNQGREASKAWLNHIRLGYNYRMDELSAALGLAQLSRLGELLQKRERVARMYNERLRDIEAVTVPKVSPNTSQMSWFVYVVRLSSDIDRDRVIEQLGARGIPTRSYFSPIHLQPFYRERFGYKEGDYPIAEAAAKSTLALPFYGNLKEDEVDYVCKMLGEVLNCCPK